MDQQNLTYSEAISKLENILGLMQSPNCDIDNLSAYTTQAISLLKYCRAKLTKCDEELKKSLETLPQASRAADTVSSNTISNTAANSAFNEELPF